MSSYFSGTGNALCILLISSSASIQHFWMDQKSFTTFIGCVFIFYQPSIRTRVTGSKSILGVKNTTHQRQEKKRKADAPLSQLALCRTHFLPLFFRPEPPNAPFDWAFALSSLSACTEYEHPNPYASEGKEVNLKGQYTEKNNLPFLHPSSFGY